MDTIHPFEAAGLGKAPFHFIGVSFAEGDSNCSFCGKKIRNVYSIRESGGSVFGVGCDCVKKTGDKELISIVEYADKKHKKEMRIRSEKEKIIRLLSEYKEAREILKNIPFKHGAFFNWKTEGEYFDSVIQNNSGAAKIAYLERALMTARLHKAKKEREA